MKTPTEVAIDTLRRYGYSATESTTVGYIDVKDPYVLRNGAGHKGTGFDIVCIHGMHVWEFLDKRG